MTRKAFGALVALAGVSLLAAGCPKNKPAVGQAAPVVRLAARPAPASTPKDAAVNFVLSLENNNKELFLGTLDLKDEDKDFAGTLFDMGQAMLAFHRDMVQAYGEEAMKDTAMNLPSVDDINRKMEVTGDPASPNHAVGKMGGDRSKDMEFTRKDGVWKIKPTQLIPPAEQRPRVVRMAQAMAEAIRQVRPKIGKATIEEIKAEIDKAMEEAVGPATRAGE